jgi:hypothetical protein
MPRARERSITLERAMQIPGGGVCMKTSLVAICIGSGLLVGAVAVRQNDDVRRAIEWERYKDLAAARQAAKERKHPSVTYGYGEANREDEHALPQRQRVVDPGPPAYRKVRPEK